MKIYAAEINLGLKDKILASQVVKSCSTVKPMKNASRIAEVQDAHFEYIKTTAGKTFASYNDLYFVQTILVSSTMNRNDDYFPAEEIWRARNTPEHKPTNIGHDMNYICGTMCRSWVLTKGKKKIVPNNVAEKDLPSTIHLACSAVIWRDLQCFYQDQISKLIVDIEAEEMAVSMEAHFDNFDYALLNESTGTVTIVTRNEETAWMSGLLRWFGGPGVHTVKDKDDKIIEVYRIGRALRDITFTGKGFVKNPANPDSIILEKSFEPMSAAEVQKTAACNNVANQRVIGSPTKKETKTMSDISVEKYGEAQAKALFATQLEKDNEKLRAKVEELEKQTKTDAKAIADFQFSKRDMENLIEVNRKEITAKDARIKELSDAVEAAKKDKEEDSKKMKEKAEEFAKFQKEKAEEIEKIQKEKAEEIDKLQKELAEIKKNQLAAERQAILLKDGMEAQEAEAFVKTYANFDDAQFKAIAATTIEANRTKAVLEHLKKTKNVTAEDLEGMKPETEVDATKKEEDAKKKDADDKSKSSGSIFASLGLPSPKVGA